MSKYLAELWICGETCDKNFDSFSFRSRAHTREQFIEAVKKELIQKNINHVFDESKVMQFINGELCYQVKLRKN